MNPQTRNRLGPLILIVIGVVIYLAATGKLVPLWSKLSASLNPEPSPAQWWESNWRPIDADVAIPWLELTATRQGVSGQYVTEAKTPGFHVSVPISGGEARPPDALLFTIETTEAGKARSSTSTNYYLLMKRSESTAELFRLASIPAGAELHLHRSGQEVSKQAILIPADPEKLHQRIAVLTKAKPGVTIPASDTATKEGRQ